MKKVIAALFIALGGAEELLAADEITYTKHIAPILWKHCAICHRPGEVGPFSLLTYKDAGKRADYIVEVTAKREMPPWKPEPGDFEFHDARRLTDQELATLAQWARTGAKEGDPGDLPPAPAFPEPGEWQLGKPDLILKMPEPFTVPASGADLYRCFVIPTDQVEDKRVSAVEFRPGNRRVVHHGIFFLDNSGQARAKDKADLGLGYEVFGGLGGIIPSGEFGAWTPGMTPRFLPPDACMYMRKGSDLVMQVHYQPSGKPETDQSTLALYFGKNPAAKSIMPIPLVNFHLRIPAGAARHRVTASFTLPVNVTAVGTQPHMHNLGREIKASALLPNGERKTLISIKDWNFNWQDRYLYKEPIPLPKGTRLECEAFYDNSAANPLNPHQPPKEVSWGEGTSDEMLLCPVYVIPERGEDYDKIMLSMAFIPGLVQRWILEKGQPPAAPLGPVKKVPNLMLQDIDGQRWPLHGKAGKKATVLVFLSTECPVCNHYLPVLATLAKQYEAKGVTFAGVYANRDETVDEIKKHAQEFRLPFTLLRDEQHVSVRAMRAATTPEAFILDGDFRVRYQGRIDDLYASRLRKKSKVTRHDLQAALNEVLAEKPVTVPITQSVGCPIPREADPNANRSKE